MNKLITRCFQRRGAFSNVYRRLAFALAIGAAAPCAFAADFAWTGGASGDFSDAGNWGGASGEIITFASGDNVTISADAATTITLDRNVTVGTLTFDGSGDVTIDNPAQGDAYILNATKVVSTSSADVTVNAKVRFATTYNVDFESASAAVNFAGGAVATYPESAITALGEKSHTLRGNITFTTTWAMAKETTTYFRVPNGSRLRGTTLTGNGGNSYEAVNGRPGFRVEEGGYAEFDNVEVGIGKAKVSVWGTLKVNGLYTTVTGSSDSQYSHVGFDGDQDHAGAIYADGIHKTGRQRVWWKIKDVHVGSQGFGVDENGNGWRINLDGGNNTHAIHFAEDGEIFGRKKSTDGEPYDWCLSLEGKTLVVDTGDNTVTWSGGFQGGNSGGKLNKSGAGTLVMNPSGVRGGAETRNVEVQAGTMVLKNNLDIEGSSGSVTVKNGATLEVAAGIATPCNIVLEEGSTLVLREGASIAGSLTVPASGKATIVAKSTAVSTFGTLASDPTANLTLDESNGYAGTLTWDSSTSKLSFTANAARTLMWSGADGADFAAAANWNDGGATATSAPSEQDTVVFDGAATVALGADACVGTLRIAGADAVTFNGANNTLTVGKIETTGAGSATMNCKVAFDSTYNVELADNTAVNFAGGATATCPDAAMTSRNAASHTFNGDITFTRDWSIPEQTTPFVVADGATVTGRRLTGTSTAATGLEIAQGGTATFNEIVCGVHQLNLSVNGTLKATGDILVGGYNNGWPNAHSDFGTDGDTGKVVAKGLFSASHSNVRCRVPNYEIGEHGIGSKTADWMLDFMQDTTVTATSDFAIVNPLRTSANNGHDWGVTIKTGCTLTIDTNGHTVDWGSSFAVVSADGSSFTDGTDGHLAKAGEGTLVLDNRSDALVEASGAVYVKRYGNLSVNAGTVRVMADGLLGQGSVTVASGATLKVEDGIPVANLVPGDGAVELGYGSTLTFNPAGSAVEFSGAVSGAGRIDVQDTVGEEGSVTFSGETSEFTGKFSVLAGALYLPDNHTLNIDSATTKVVESDKTGYTKYVNIDAGGNVAEATPNGGTAQSFATLAEAVEYLNSNAGTITLLANCYSQNVTLAPGQVLELDGHGIGAVTAASGAILGLVNGVYTAYSSDTAEPETWTGLGDNDRWDNAANWSLGFVPLATTPVTFTPGDWTAGLYKAGQDSQQCASLTVNGNVTLDRRSGDDWADLGLNGDIDGRGTLTLNNTGLRNLVGATKTNEVSCAFSLTGTDNVMGGRWRISGNVTVDGMWKVQGNGNDDTKGVEVSGPAAFTANADLQLLAPLTFSGKTTLNAGFTMTQNWNSSGVTFTEVEVAANAVLPSNYASLITLDGTNTVGSAKTFTIPAGVQYGENAAFVLGGVGAKIVDGTGSLTGVTCSAEASAGGHTAVNINDTWVVAATWQPGEESDGKWTTADNWSTGTAPTMDTAVVFSDGATVNLDGAKRDCAGMVVNGNVEIVGGTISTQVGLYGDVSGSGILTMSGSGLKNLRAETALTVAPNVVFRNMDTQPWLADEVGNGITINGDVTFVDGFKAWNKTHTIAGTTTFSGPAFDIADGTGLKLGAVTVPANVTVTRNNATLTFDGKTTIAAHATLEIPNDNGVVIGENAEFVLDGFGATLVDNGGRDKEVKVTNAIGKGAKIIITTDGDKKTYRLVPIGFMIRLR